MMTCTFCRQEIKDDYDPSGQPYGKVSCRNHKYGDRPIHVEFTRRAISVTNIGPNPYKYGNELSRADITFNWPIEDELTFNELWLSWNLEDKRFQMVLLEPMGDYYEHDYILNLDYLPDWITPENAYPVALRLLNQKAFL